MADFTPIGNTGKTQEPFGAVNSILGIAGKAQELKIQGFALQQAQNFTKFQKNFDIVKYMDKKTGILDASAAYQGDEFKNAGNAQELAQQYIQRIQSGQAEYKTKLNTLNDDALTHMYQRNFALSNNPDVQADNDAGRQAVRDSYDQLKQQYPTAAELLDHFAQVADPVKGAPKNKLADALYFQGAQGFDTANAREQFNPQPYDFPDGTQGFRDPRTGYVWHAHESPHPPPGSPAAAAAAPPPNAPARPAGGGGAAAAPTSFFKPNGQPRAAGDDRPGSMEPDQVRNAYWADAADAQKHVADVRKADADYGSNKTILSSIRSLSYDTSSGPGSLAWQNALGAIGAVTGTTLGSNYQQMGAWLDRLATQGQTDLPQTNAGLAASQRIVGNTSYSPETIRAKTNYVEGLNDSQHAYRSGLDAITGHGAVQPSPKVVNHFKEMWAANNDPRIFEIDAAIRRGDTDAAIAIADELTPQEKISFKKQRQALMKLSRGQMP